MFASLIAALVLCAACQGGGSAKELSGKVSIVGSSTAATFITPLIESFRNTHPRVEVKLQLASSSWGLGSLRAGMAQMAITTSSPNPGEAGLVAHAVARDGLAILVNAQNPVGALTDEQTHGIFAGKITSWKDVGGKDETIALVVPAESRQSLPRFAEYLRFSPGELADGDVVANQDADAVRQIAHMPGGITYLSIASARYAIDDGAPVKLIGFGGIDPTEQNVAAGKVPIIYDVSLVTQGEPIEVARAILDLAASAEGGEIRARRHFAPPA